MAIREVSMQQLEDISGAGAGCQDLVSGFYGGLGGVLGATAGAGVGGWVGRRLCSYLD
ncbi:hypothetical protein J9978_19250 [Chromobacterium violaceum]|uniref:hypothetical protein n=1 Tax=Chromobacterium violaceum TaxID=536 RepID=UPI001B31A08C|nr:hypothetical protein [Chromobacterium violaceum]MBP4051616.1 hypothetical protein [Chromobacterium violaceum]